MSKKPKIFTRELFEEYFKKADEKNRLKYYGLPVAYFRVKPGEEGKIITITNAARIKDVANNPHVSKANKYVFVPDLLIAGKVGTIVNVLNSLGYTKLDNTHDYSEGVEGEALKNASTNVDNLYRISIDPTTEAGNIFIQNINEQLKSKKKTKEERQAEKEAKMTEEETFYNTLVSAYESMFPEEKEKKERKRGEASKRLSSLARDFDTTMSDAIASTLGVKRRLKFYNVDDFNPEKFTGVTSKYPVVTSYYQPSVDYTEIEQEPPFYKLVNVKAVEDPQKFPAPSYKRIGIPIIASDLNKISEFVQTVLPYTRYADLIDAILGSLQHLGNGIYKAAGTQASITGVSPKLKEGSKSTTPTKSPITKVLPKMQSPVQSPKSQVVTPMSPKTTVFIPKTQVPQQVPQQVKQGKQQVQSPVKSQQGGGQQQFLFP